MAKKSSTNKSDKKKRHSRVPIRLAEKLRQIRVRGGLTQAKMLIIVNPDYSEENRARVSQFERGMRIPSLVEVYNYAKFAGVAVEILLDDDLELPQK